MKPLLDADFDYALLRLPYLNYWLKANVTGQQGMLTPPRYLIPHQVYPEVCVCLYSFLYFIVRLIKVRYFCVSMLGENWSLCARQVPILNDYQHSTDDSATYPSIMVPAMLPIVLFALEKHLHKPTSYFSPPPACSIPSMN